VFDRHTFADIETLNRRPFVMLNATDMSMVSRFEFTQDQFDVIGSDLSSYPIARGVAASSAFPLLLSPLTLKNYAPAPNYKQPKWLEDALSDRADAPREYAYAMGIQSYLQSTNHPFVHLMDGGLSDNIGLRGPAYAMTSVQNLWSLKYLLNTKIKNLVVVTVNSKPASPNNWDRSEKAPGLSSQFSVVSSGPMGNYSDETVQYIKDTLETWRQEIVDSNEIARLKGQPQQALRKIEFYNVSVSFDDVTDLREREFLNSQPTSFHLSRESVDRLRTAAHKIILESSELERLRNDLNSAH
jgi:NTE family protein